MLAQGSKGLHSELRDFMASLLWAFSEVELHGREGYMGEQDCSHLMVAWREQGRCGGLNGNGPLKLIYLSS